MRGWQDWGHDAWGQHRYVKTVAHVRCVVSSGSFGIFTVIRVGGRFAFPQGLRRDATPLEACAFLDSLLALVATLPLIERDAALLASTEGGLLPWMDVA